MFKVTVKLPSGELYQYYSKDLTELNPNMGYLVNGVMAYVVSVFIV